MSLCPSPRSRPQVAYFSGLFAALLSHLSLAGAPAPDAARLAESFLAVRVNGEMMPVTLLLQEPDGRVMARTSDLLRWRFVLPQGTTVTHEGDSFLSLDAIAGVRWRIEPDTQTLAIDTVASNFLPTVMSVDAARTAPPPPVGGFFNYDLSTQSINHQTFYGGLFEAVAFSPWGSLAATAVARSGVTSDIDGRTGNNFTRLNTTWTLDRPGEAATWRIGDTISQAGSWGRPVRIGGIQYATNFTTRPGFITFPMPGFAGEAALPSTVDIYVNDALRMRRDVLAGPFSIPQLPALTGMGEARVVVRDLLGRQQTLVTPFYASTQLLRQGLRDFSYEIGAIRSNYGTLSADYGRLAAVGTERRGLSDTLTGELHGEVTQDRQAAGVGAAWLWPSAGVFTASLATSRGRQGVGGLASAGFQRQTRQLSFGGSVTMTSGNYTALGLPTDPSVPKKLAQAFASYATPNYGAVALNYIQQDFRERSGVQLVSASWGLAIGRVGYLSLAVQRELRGDQTRVGLTFSRALDARTSMSASASTNTRGDNRNVQAQVQRNLPVGSGVGYRLMTAGGDVARTEGAVMMQSDYGTYEVGASTYGGDMAYRAGMAGGFAMIGTDAFASRTIRESFSVVKVPGYSDVRVYAANQLVGRTNSSGAAMVPRLLPYQANSIRIEQADLPLDATVDTLAFDVVPTYRSGVLAQFPVRRSRGGLVTVLLDDGGPLPSGAVARLAGNEQEFPAAQQGEIYLTQLSRENTMEVSWLQQRCTIKVVFPETTDPLPHLGTFFCHGVNR
ncbi:fimbrial biogenesis outer membrane usher protein [Pigmentiphaga litoralis]|uniref:fimbria/pilus outer membrane usher protein n=1 Tax=Pigmentiphaga litoralis TaxID=516702 RepID=UPI00167694CE|nr:fimbria/pilus outer membrane usher protein [Pigmentiphaga litoralis]GGX19809.1 fimbrial biogenesis outer membrane usher protein [Pigmentiphaga litoralis]